jgi:hypothetical protein
VTRRSRPTTVEGDSQVEIVRLGVVNGNAEANLPGPHDIIEALRRRRSA